ncbi:hypothetical protein ACHHYP_20206 [Achlya hypogyna]|uniref:Uncharacterized protein n=1 Tax=Achlya hypogyna TaxID=1202772 RepID=A0A1V9YY77_ACHHY|nr:hypothetical protein ACHHYP_20206 [Achlya hypogyna]
MNWMLVLTTLNLVITALYFYKSVVLLELTQELNIFDKLHSEHGRAEIADAWEAIEAFHDDHERPACAYAELLKSTGKPPKALDRARERLVHWYQKVVYLHRHGLLEDRLFAEFPGAYRTQQFMAAVEPLTLVHCAHYEIPNCGDVFAGLRELYALPPREEDACVSAPAAVDEEAPSKDEL